MSLSYAILIYCFISSINYSKIIKKYQHFSVGYIWQSMLHALEDYVAFCEKNELTNMVIINANGSSHQYYLYSRHDNNLTG